MDIDHRSVAQNRALEHRGENRISNASERMTAIFSTSLYLIFFFFFLFLSSLAKLFQRQACECRVFRAASGSGSYAAATSITVIRPPSSFAQSPQISLLQLLQFHDVVHIPINMEAKDQRISDDRSVSNDNGGQIFLYNARFQLNWKEVELNLRRQKKIYCDNLRSKMVDF